MTEFTREQWASAVHAVLAAHPDWVADTVNAMQAGVVEALDRQKDRTLTVSLGLVEAVRTERRSKGRVHDRIIKAIEVSNFHPTPWSKSAIEQETRNRDRKKET